MNSIKFSNKYRAQRVGDWKEKKLDIIVIGGGITGAGIIFDATNRGLKTLLVEKKDFASGTSSKSTKLIHGGLRYLKQLEFGLVRETGLERAIAHKNICHLVHPEEMLLPIVKDGIFNGFTAGLAIGVYDRLANVPSEYRKKSLSKKETLERVPMLNSDLLKSGIFYSEYRTDDARLTIELIKSSRKEHGEAFNYMEVIDFIYEDNKICGIICHDRITNEKIKFKAKYIISSTGPWVDELKQIDSDEATKNLHLSKGVHIVISRDKLPIDTSVYFDVFDERMIFAIPRGQVVYIGTTDTTFKGDKDDLRCTKADADYLIDAVNKMFPQTDLSLADIQSTWTGLRPLIQQTGKSATELSRKDEIFISDSGLISIAGGKLTGYRKMAKRIVDLVVQKEEDWKSRKCKTKRLLIHPDSFKNYTEYLEYIEELKLRYSFVDDYLLWFLSSTYGKSTNQILESVTQASDLSPEKQIVKNQLTFTIENESVFHPLDFLDRRTGWLFFNINQLRENADYVSELIVSLLGIESNKIDNFKSEISSAVDIHSLRALKNLNN